MTTVGLFRAVARDLPDRVPVAVRDHHEDMITLGQFRAVIEGLSDEVPLEVAIRDRLHFNALLGDLPVTGVVVTQGPTSPVVVLDVPGVSYSRTATPDKPNRIVVPSCMTRGSSTS